MLPEPIPRYRPILLLVADQPDAMVNLETVLNDGQRELLRASSGEEAQYLLIKHDVTLVLLDVQMPGTDGYEVAKIHADADSHTRSASPDTRGYRPG